MADFTLPEQPEWTEHTWVWNSDGPRTEATDGSPIRIRSVVITEYPDEVTIEAQGWLLRKDGERDQRRTAPMMACKAWRDEALAQWKARRALQRAQVPTGDAVVCQNTWPAEPVEDECYDAQGNPLPYGRCDTCGAPCDAQGCTTDRSHEIALP